MQQSNYITLATGFCLVVSLGVFQSGCTTSSTVEKPQAKLSSPKKQYSSSIISPVAQLVRNEALLRTAEQTLERLNQSLQNLRLIPTENVSLFAPNCLGRDLASIELGESNELPSNAIVELTELRPLGSLKLAVLWSKLVKKFEFISESKFHVVRITDDSQLPQNFTTKVEFEGLGLSRTGSWLSISASGKIEWSKTDFEQIDWLINKWDFERFAIHHANNRIFEDVTASSLNTNELDFIRRTGQREILNGLLQEDASVPAKFFDPNATAQHPNVSITDINNDGFDDLYVSQPWKRNLLYVNNRDGTFTESSNDYDLSPDNQFVTSLFADFDNDGDQDLFLGGPFCRCAYLEHDGSGYVDRSREKFEPLVLPAMASAFSAVDFNSDGLLDIYVSTYGFPNHLREVENWSEEFLSFAQARELTRRVRAPKHNRFFNLAGPPNLLLQNTGEGFKVPKINTEVELYTNSLQSTWTDFDNDGDQDLYVANDFAADNLFRNEGEQGFHDVTEELGHSMMMGFGTGASWGDYDMDGYQDLFVSNIYSDAAMRVVEHFPRLADEFVQSANGNRLYRNVGGQGFELASSNRGGGLAVNKAGWSWGGQFIDFDNDSDLDIYVPSGYFTAPQAFATDYDLCNEYWRSVVRSRNGLPEKVRQSVEWGPATPTFEVDELDGKKTANSINGNEKNRLFTNYYGDVFEDSSLISGVDSISDGRGFAICDYDRDGLQDIVLVNANEPLLQIYRNQSSNYSNHAHDFIAIRLEGGNATSAPSNEWSNRNGIGAKIIVETNGNQIFRELRCGQGLGDQNSMTQIVGLGRRHAVDSVTIMWPSGKTQTTSDIASGSLLVCFENPEMSSDNEPFMVSEYKNKIVDTANHSFATKSTFAPSSYKLESAVDDETVMRVFVTLTTRCESCKSQIPALNRLARLCQANNVGVYLSLIHI